MEENRALQDKISHTAATPGVEADQTRAPAKNTAENGTAHCDIFKSMILN